MREVFVIVKKYDFDCIKVAMYRYWSGTNFYASPEDAAKFVNKDDAKHELKLMHHRDACLEAGIYQIEKIFVVGKVKGF
jgi:hypothetical protein